MSEIVDNTPNPSELVISVGYRADYPSVMQQIAASLPLIGDTSNYRYATKRLWNISGTREGMPGPEDPYYKHVISLSRYLLGLCLSEPKYSFAYPRLAQQPGETDGAITRPAQYYMSFVAARKRLPHGHEGVIDYIILAANRDMELFGSPIRFPVHPDSD